MEIYKPLGLVAIIILLAGLAFFIRRWPQGMHATFSQHAAAHRSAVVYYNLLFTIVLPLLLLFFLGWFVPRLTISSAFSVCVVAWAIAQYIATLVPESGGRKTVWHRAVTFVSVLFLLSAAILLLFEQAFSIPAKLVIGAGLVVMLGVMTYMAIVRGKHNYLLLWQAGYYAAFFIPVLLVAYARL